MKYGSAGRLCPLTTMTFDPSGWKIVLGAIPGMDFSLLRSESLSPAQWNMVGTPVTGTAEEVVFTLDPPVDEGGVFYQVLMQP